jgi:hypothetical protein
MWGELRRFSYSILSWLIGILRANAFRATLLANDKRAFEKAISAQTLHLKSKGPNGHFNLA